MLVSHLKLARLLLLTGVALTAGGLFLFKKYDAPPRGKTELGTLHRRVLLGLEDLMKHPAAAGFAAELEADSGLRRALDAGFGPEETSRFKALVAKHAQDPSFLKAVENPASEVAPCAEGTATGAPVRTGEPDPLLGEAEPGCAKDEPALGLLPQ